MMPRFSSFRVKRAIIPTPRSRSVGNGIIENEKTDDQKPDLGDVSIKPLHFSPPSRNPSTRRWFRPAAGPAPGR